MLLNKSIGPINNIEKKRTARSSSRLLGMSASVHAGIPPPGCVPGDSPPPQCGAGDPPGQTPQLPPPPLWALNHPRPNPLGVGLETCNACWDTTTPRVNRITDTCKNITFPQLRLRAVKRCFSRNN